MQRIYLMMLLPVDPATALEVAKQIAIVIMQEMSFILLYAKLRKYNKSTNVYTIERLDACMPARCMPRNKNKKQ